MEFIFFVFTRMPGESYHKRLRILLLRLCEVVRAPINSLFSWLCGKRREERDVDHGGTTTATTAKDVKKSVYKEPVAHSENCDEFS